MRSIRRAGLWLALGLAMSATLSATASAEPVFLTKAAIGEAVSSVPFTGTVAGSAWESTHGTKITCLAGTLTGEVTGPKSLSGIVLHLTGCTTSGCKVESAGQPEGSVYSNVLAGKLGGITATLPGVKLYSEAEGKGGKMVEASTCAGAVPIIWKGEVTGSLSGAAGESPATGKLLPSLKLTLAESKGVQKYQGFTEGLESGLMGQLQVSVSGGAYEPNGWTLAPTLTTVPASWGLGVTK
jgi:hypothetical protein